MKKTLLVSFSLLLLCCFSCVKQKDDTTPPVVVDPNAITPPAGFLWELSKNVNISIGTNDDRFGDAIHTISVYDANPDNGGSLIAKGAASTGKPFNTTIFLADTVRSLFVVKTSPDNATMLQEITVSGSINATIGAVPVPAGRPLDEPDCKTGCSRTITASNNNIEVKSGEVVCITGNNITVSYTANDNGTVRICGSNVTVQNSNLNNKSKLIVTSSGSVTFQNLNINSGISFENYGTCTLTNGFAPNGPVTNSGKLVIGSDFNINSSGSLINRGTITVKSSMNVNSSGNSNKGTITTQSFTINGSAVFTNLCSLVIAKDYNNNGTMANYQLITVGGTTTVNGGSELGLYNSAMIVTNDMMLNGMIKGYGITSIAKVANRTTINGGAGATGAVQYCDATGIEVNNMGKSAFVNGAVQACSVYIPAGDCNSIGNGKPVIVDTDGDGTPDATDEFPTDASKAFNNYYPSANGKATVAFEDLWPSKGDYDFNDLVMDYHYNIITNSSNKIATVINNFTLLASGGSLSNGFGFEFPVTRASVSNVKGGKLEENQANAVIVLFTNMRDQMIWSNTVESKPQSAPPTYTVSFDIKNGPLLSSIGIGTYNPFIWNNLTSTGKERNEIHLPGHHPTSLGNSSLFGTKDDNTSVSGNKYYLSKAGMPWALTIPTVFKYPKEGANINAAYTHFTGWANSGGLSYTNFYSDQSGYRVNSFIYKP